MNFIIRFFSYEEDYFSSVSCYVWCPSVGRTTRAERKVRLIQGDNKIDVMTGGKLFIDYLYESKLTKSRGVWKKLIDERLYIS